MQASDYEVLKNQIKGKTSENLRGGLIILVMSVLTLGAMYLSSVHTGIVWFTCQVLLGFFILQWFFLLHDLGHGHFFSRPLLNKIFGLFASFFVMLPFFSWKYVHRHHHLWTGWKDKDPTMTIIVPEKIPGWQKFVMNFCWKYWIPIFSLSFSLSNFWNVPKLVRLFPQKKFRFIFSILFVCLTHLGIILVLDLQSYLHIWGFAYLIFFIISDPLLLSQHAGIPQHHSRNEKVGQFHMRDQDDFTRSLIFPKLLRRFFFFGFNNHGLHHLYPTLPCYHLSAIDHRGKNDIHWYEWLRTAKRTSAVDLLNSKEL
jgi:omega-6 fatty acid desaturase (delta-12 desaturase)